MYTQVECIRGFLWAIPDFSFRVLLCWWKKRDEWLAMVLEEVCGKSAVSHEGTSYMMNYKPISHNYQKTSSSKSTEMIRLTGILSWNFLFNVLSHQSDKERSQTGKPESRIIPTALSLSFSDRRWYNLSEQKYSILTRRGPWNKTIVRILG
jgi:hypothetical protein